MSLFKAAKSIREILRLAVFRKFPKVPVLKKTVPKESCQQVRSYQQTSHNRQSSSLGSRVLRSIIARSGSVLRPFISPLKARNAGIDRTRRIPFLSLVGLSMGVDMKSLSEGYTENTMKAVREIFKDYQWEPSQLCTHPTCLNDLDINQSSVIGRGCEGAVFEARLKANQNYKEDCLCNEDNLQEEKYDLAVKAVFNYGAESNASSILRELNREVVPLQNVNKPSSSSEVDELIDKSISRLPSHPNVVDMHCAFIDDMLVTEQGKQEYPAALPRRLNPEGSFGRNKTLYLVMKKCCTRLSDFLPRDLSMATRCLMLTQLLEAVAHINSNGIAHRDIKLDNILLDISHNNECPHIRICDFGCCLASENKQLVVPYFNNDINIGGNSWLMAPEISCARPGNGNVLDFRKSDLWACGALAYSILGAENPFYPNNIKQLSSKSYLEEELPSLPDTVPVAVKRLVKSLLHRNPEKRPSARVAALVALMTSWELTDNSKITRRNRRVVSTKCNRMSRYIDFRQKQRQKMEVLIGKTFDLVQRMAVDSSILSHDVIGILNFLCLSRMNLNEFHQALRFF